MQRLDVSFIDASSIFIKEDLSINGDLSVNGSAFLQTISAEHIFIDGSGLSEYIEGTTQDLFSDGNQDVTFNTVTINNTLNMFHENTSINLNAETIINYGSFLPYSLVIPNNPDDNRTSNNYIYLK